MSYNANVDMKDACRRRPLDIVIEVVQIKKPWAPRAEHTEMMEWLTPPKRGYKSQPEAPLLGRPTPKDRMLIDKRPIYLLDISRRGWIETSAFSVRSAIYKYGPRQIMKALDSSYNCVYLDEENYILSWIHLPGNSVSPPLHLPCCRLDTKLLRLL